jgi:hypothetical protein
MRHRPLALALVLAALAAAPALAYTIYLKDGSTITAKEKYRVENGRVIFTMANGAAGALRLSELDQAKTEAANKTNYGTATVLEQTVTPVTPSETPAKKQESLSDYIKTEGGLRALPTTHREERAKGAPPSKTKAGYDDLVSWDRSPPSDLDLATAVKRVYRTEGVEDVDVFAGSQRKRLLVEAVTNSEAAIFRAIDIAAKALVEVQRSSPGAIDALELVMITPQRARAGQFVVTPDLAAEIAAKPDEIAVVFVRNVQF